MCPPKRITVYQGKEPVHTMEGHGRKFINSLVAEWERTHPVNLNYHVIVGSIDDIKPELKNCGRCDIQIFG